MGFRWAPLHYRHVQLQFCDLIKRRYNWEDLVSLNCSSLSDLSWWKSCPSVLTPVSLVIDRHDFTLTTDASKLGWGAFLSSGSQTSGLWSGSEQEMHINNLELLAVFNCVCSFLDELKNSKGTVYTVRCIARLIARSIGRCISYAFTRIRLIGRFVQFRLLPQAELTGNRAMTV